MSTRFIWTEMIIYYIITHLFVTYYMVVLYKKYFFDDVYSSKVDIWD